MCDRPLPVARARLEGAPAPTANRGGVLAAVFPDLTKAVANLYAWAAASDRPASPPARRPARPATPPALKHLPSAPDGPGTAPAADTGPAYPNRPGRHCHPLPPQYRNRRACHCGCGKRATHVGVADGIALMDGCGWSVRRWAKEPPTPVDDPL
jgi:hypothetical protein